MRSAAAIVAVALGLSVAVAHAPPLASASGPVPPTLPPGAMLFDSNRTGNLELFVLQDGAVRQLTSDSRFDSFWPKVSPDGITVAFHRTPRGVRDRDYSKASTWMVGAGGADLRQVLAVGAHGWSLQAHVEWSPDGRQLALIGGPPGNPQIFVVDRTGDRPRRVTRDGAGGPRPGTNIDPSWAPDGRSLLFVGCPIALCTEALYEVYRVNLDGTGEVRLTYDLAPDYDPYWAPDASAIAWLRNTGGLLSWGVFLMGPDGGGARPLINDGATNSKPNWADASTIYFHRAPGATGGSPLFNIYRVSTSGAGLTRLLPDHGGAFDNEYPEVVPARAGTAPAPPPVTAAPVPPTSPAPSAPTSAVPTPSAPTSAAPTSAPRSSAPTMPLPTGPATATSMPGTSTATTGPGHTMVAAPSDAKGDGDGEARPAGALLVAAVLLALAAALLLRSRGTR